MNILEKYPLFFKLENINLSFGPVKVLKNMNLELYKGAGVALIGENGAGKSTLMKVLSGVHQPDSGKMSFCENNICDKKVEFYGVIDSQKQGIAIIHQEQHLVENLTVAQNIFLGREFRSSLGLLDYKKQDEEAKKLLNILGVDFSPKAIVSSLSVSQRQFIEIAKALSQNQKIIIFDEPTSVLTEKDTQKLYDLVKKLKKQGIAIVWITHRMEEIEQTCEFITVIRNGMYIDSKPTVEFKNEDEIISLMVGFDIEHRYPEKTPVLSKNPSFLVKNLSNEKVANISFDIKPGEILIFYGLVSSGRTELARTLIGDMPYLNGHIELNGKEFKPKNIKDSLNHGIYYLSEDRKQIGLNVNLPINFNITISSLNSNEFSRYLPLISKTKISQTTNSYIKQLKIKTSSQENPATSLSGGNQQKVSIAKGLATEPQFFILDEPTRGVDVGARKEIYNLIHQLKQENKTIMIISSDMQEVIGIADRVITMYEGRITGELVGDQITDQNIMKYSLNLQKGN